MVRVRGKNQRRQYASEEAERRKDVKVEFRVSHYLLSDTLLSYLLGRATQFTTLLEPVSLQAKLVHTHIPCETLALVHCSEVTLKKNPQGEPHLWQEGVPGAGAFWGGSVE